MGCGGLPGRQSPRARAPFGEKTETQQPALTAEEQKGFIGERHDADAGLQYSTPAPTTPSSACSSSPTGSRLPNPAWEPTGTAAPATIR